MLTRKFPLLPFTYSFLKKIAYILELIWFSIAKCTSKLQNYAKKSSRLSKSASNQSVFDAPLNFFIWPTYLPLNVTRDSLSFVLVLKRCCAETYRNTSLT